MNGTRKFVVAAVGIVTSLAVLGGGGVASAEPLTQEYHPLEVNRDFGDSLGGWKARNQYKGLCIQTLTCPPLRNSHGSTGGASGAGDGFLLTALMDLTGLVSEERVFWEGPVFKWRGVDNEEPDGIRFTIDRKTNLQALLLLGGSATYRVDAIDATNGANVAQVIVPKRNLDGTTSWRREGPFTVARDALKLGNRYFIRITTVFNTNAQVIDNGANAYDNVILTAKAKQSSIGGTQGRGHKRTGISCRNPSIQGTAESETLKGTAKKDVIAGFGGADRIAGKAGNDVLCGGEGNDILRGNAGRDRMSGGSARDRCIGGSGRDRAANSCDKTTGVP